MSFVRRLIGPGEQRATLSKPSSWLVDALTASGKTFTGRGVTPESALQTATVYAAVRIIAESVGSVPLIVYREQNGRRERATDSRLWGLLHDEPNPEQASGEFCEVIAGHLAIYGNAFVYKERDTNGLVIALWPIHPSRVRVGRIDGQKVFEVRNPQGGGTSAGSERDILHIKAFGVDGLVGLSPIQQARQLIACRSGSRRVRGQVLRQLRSPLGASHHHPHPLG